MWFDETLNISVNIPVTRGRFNDEKELNELFAYVLDNSVLMKNHHPKNTFYLSSNYGSVEYKFIITLNANDDRYKENYIKRKAELIELANDYAVAEDQYFQFRKFGNIESNMFARRTH